MASGSKDPGRSVISKISAILLAVSEGSAPTLTEIAARSDLPLSTVHRLVTELAAWRVLERDGEGRYRAGPPLRTIGAGSACSGHELDDGAATPAARASCPVWSSIPAPTCTGCSPSSSAGCHF